MSNEKLIAIAVFAMDYHEGQFSKLYRLGCIAQQKLRKYGITLTDWTINNCYKNNQFYRKLVSKHGE